MPPSKHVSKHVTVDVDGRRLKVSNLDKVLYPETGFRKGEVIDYYVRIAPVLLPHITDRPLTLLRYPDGVDAPSFFEKDVSRHAPDWVRTVEVATPGSAKGAESLDFAVVDDLPTLVWVANLASLELHVPQWKIGPRGGRRDPDLLVFDLDHHRPILPARPESADRLHPPDLGRGRILRDRRRRHLPHRRRPRPSRRTRRPVRRTTDVRAPQAPLTRGRPMSAPIASNSIVTTKTGHTSSSYSASGSGISSFGPQRRLRMGLMAR